MNFSQCSLFMYFLVICVLYNFVTPTPTSGSAASSSSPFQPRRLNLQSILGINANSMDQQTRKDMRILSLFENEINRIFNCFIRLSCPKQRDAQAIADCEELKDWPLYHQVMRMTGIKKYPYQNYAPWSVYNQNTVSNSRTVAPRSRRSRLVQNNDDLQ